MLQLPLAEQALLLPFQTKCCLLPWFQRQNNTLLNQLSTAVLLQTKILVGHLKDLLKIYDNLCFLFLQLKRINKKSRSSFDLLLWRKFVRYGNQFLIILSGTIITWWLVFLTESWKTIMQHELFRKVKLLPGNKSQIHGFLTWRDLALHLDQCILWLIVFYSSLNH